ncbi:MAG: outer membrane protein assembly factor BamA [Geminicoccaceae bacterium]|nr:MAG: outer membrane protein assembly factor BamA [Geminicoccaceae bacterium]
MARRARLALLIAACVACWVVMAPLPGAAQTAGTIADIRVEGNERIEPSFVEIQLTVGIGDPFDPAALDASLRSLFATGLFEDVRLERDGNVLVVVVRENPFINRIAFEGNRRLGDDALASEIDLRSREVFSRARVQTAVARILELYRRTGRFGATVEPKIIELDQNRVDLVFEITEGPLTRVTGISFVGNRNFSDSRLREVIQTTESRFWRVFTTADTYDPDRLAFDEELLRRFYFDRGFIDFEVRSAIAELTPEGDGFFITFTIDEGERYRFGAIDVESRIRDLDARELQGLVRMRQGQVYRARDVEATIQAMVERVGQLGYAFVDIDPLLRRNAEDRTVDILFVVNEGPRVFVERIEIINNLRTLDEVIRRELLLAEGDAFNSALLRESERRVRRLGYFARVEFRTRAGSAPDRTVIEIEVEEQATGELSFGAGFSTTDGPLAQVVFAERNLLGTGRAVRASFTISGRRQDIDFSYTEPWLLGYEVAGGIDVFNRQTDFQDEGSFDERSTGFVLRASYPLTRDITHVVRYGLREDEIRSVREDASPFIKAEKGDSITSSIGQSFIIDRRDNFQLPNEGYSLRLDQDFAGLGGDRTFISHELSVSYFQPIVGDQVVANLRFAGGHIAGIGDDVRLSNRFFVGGNDFRGFRVGGIGPRDSVTRDALGGNLYYVGTAEVRFPLGLPEDLRFFGRAFVDAGSLTDIDVSGPNLTDSGNLRVTAGVGLTWLSPFGPLAFDFGQAVVKDNLDETEFFRFSFGTRF